MSSKDLHFRSSLPRQAVEVLYLPCRHVDVTSLSLRVRVIENDQGMEIIYVLRHERRINTLTTPIVVKRTEHCWGSALHCDISHSASGINPLVRNFRSGLENAANYRPLF